MHVNTTAAILGAVFILAGLGACALSPAVKNALLTLIAFWAGVGMLVLGLLLLLFPVLAFIYSTVTAAFGLGGT